MIGFLHPWMLAGLAAAGIPVLLHLLARREPPTVIFPAVRYLVDTTREHQRRLKLQHWLLLLLRTLLIAALMLAAAGPTLPVRGLPGHAPSALVLVLDNSVSSGALIAGTPRLAQLMAAAAAVLRQARTGDALWLIAADQVPRRGDPASLTTVVGQLEVSPRRLDLGQTVTLAALVLSAERRPAQILVVTDLQATALSATETRIPIVVARPGDLPARNVGVAAVDPGPQPWSTDGGRVAVTLTGDSGAAVPISVVFGGRPARQALGTVGGVTLVSAPGVPAGWWRADASLDGDELRLDDRRTAIVRVAPPARVDCAAAGRYAAAACAVLRQNGRLADGNEITVGPLGRGTSVVLPPEDPAAVGALNRELARRGVGWTFGAPSALAEVSDSGALVGRERIERRYALVSSASGRTGVLATAGRTPWVVRGANMVLVGSRLDPAWTGLPLSAGFMSFMDALLNRVARGEVVLLSSPPGDPVLLPDVVTEVRAGERSWRVEGGAAFRAPDIGSYFLLAGGDTVGALSVNPDPRESALTAASDGRLTQLWPGARVVPLAGAADAAFRSLARGDLRGPLLVAALLLGLAELFVASIWRRSA